MFSGMLLFSGCVGSTTYMIICAERAACCERSMPSCSMVSDVRRSPAVSRKRIRYGPISRVSSTMSRVVPWMSLTMARSSPIRALRSDDLPALVGPIIATGMPSLIAAPVSNVSARLPSSSFSFVASCRRR